MPWCYLDCCEHPVNVWIGNSKSRIPGKIPIGLSSARPGRRILQMKKHFAGFAHEQNAFLFTIRKRLDIDCRGIAVFQIDLLAHRARNPRGERHLRATTFDSIFERADASHMRRMREHAPWEMFELVPLLQEVIAAMVADFLDGLAVRYANLGNMR